MDELCLFNEQAGREFPGPRAGQDVTRSTRFRSVPGRRVRSLRLPFRQDRKFALPTESEICPSGRIGNLLHKAGQDGAV